MNNALYFFSVLICTFITKLIQKRWADLIHYVGSGSEIIILFKVAVLAVWWSITCRIIQQRTSRYPVIILTHSPQVECSWSFNACEPGSLTLPFFTHQLNEHIVRGGGLSNVWSGNNHWVLHHFGFEEQLNPGGGCRKKLITININIHAKTIRRYLSNSAEEQQMKQLFIYLIFIRLLTLEAPSTKQICAGVNLAFIHTKQ